MLIAAPPSPRALVSSTLSAGPACPPLTAPDERVLVIARDAMATAQTRLSGSLKMDFPNDWATTGAADAQMAMKLLAMTYPQSAPLAAQVNLYANDVIRRPTPANTVMLLEQMRFPTDLINSLLRK